MVVAASVDWNVRIGHCWWQVGGSFGSLCSLPRQTYGFSDPITRADAIVVLGGALQTRPFLAAEMWRRGLADKILISQPPEERAVSIGAMPNSIANNF